MYKSLYKAHKTKQTRPAVLDLVGKNVEYIHVIYIG